MIKIPHRLQSRQLQVLNKHNEGVRLQMISHVVIATSTIMAFFLVSCGHQAMAFGFNLETHSPNSGLSSTSGWSKGAEMSMRQLTFLNPSCKWPSVQVGTPTEVIKLLMIFKCDLKPLLAMLKKMLPYHNEASIKLNSLKDIENLNLDHNGKKSQQLELVWNEYMNLDESIEIFFTESISGLSRMNFCTYPFVERFAKLKQLSNGSKFLTCIYDIIAIEYHKSCLSDAISKLPQVPYLVREVVDIYISGADQAIPDLNRRAAIFDEQMGDSTDFQFDLQEALAKNGELGDVVQLSLSSPSGVDPVDTFKIKCREFLIEIEERWQSMEMMSKLLSTEGNGIQSFNNYVMRRLTPTKFADICSQLSASDV